MTPEGISGKILTIISGSVIGTFPNSKNNTIEEFLESLQIYVKMSEFLLKLHLLQKSMEKLLVKPLKKFIDEFLEKSQRKAPSGNSDKIPIEIPSEIFENTI